MRVRCGNPTEPRAAKSNYISNKKSRLLEGQNQAGSQAGRQRIIKNPPRRPNLISMCRERMSIQSSRSQGTPCGLWSHTQTHKRRTLHRGLLWFMGAWSVHKTRASRLLKALNMNQNHTKSQSPDTLFKTEREIEIVGLALRLFCC